MINVRWMAAALTTLTVGLTTSLHADVHTYQIDQSQSSLTVVDGNVIAFGAFTFDVSAQQPGSLTAPLGGEIDADISTTTLQLLNTTRVSAVDQTSYLPGLPASPSTPAPGSFAALYPTAPVLGFDFTSVTRGLIVSMEDASTKALALDGSFDAAGTTMTVVAGVADLSAGNPPQSDLTTVVPVANAATTSGTLTVDGNTETLTIPITFRMVVQGGIIVVTLDYEGTIVATRTLPCAADFNNDSTRDVADLFAYINAWLAKTPDADFDDNTTVDVADLFAYINAWLAGC